MIGGDKGRFIVDDRSAPVVKFLHLQAFDIVDAEFSAAGVREISFGNTYPVKARERRREETRTEEGGGWIGWALFRSSVLSTKLTDPARPSDARPGAALQP